MVSAEAGADAPGPPAGMPASIPPDPWRALEQELAAAHGLDAVLSALLSAALHLFPAATSSAVYLIQSGQLSAPVTRQPDGQPGGPAGEPAAQACAAAAAAGAEPRVETRLLAGTGQPLKLLALPLKFGDRPVGVMALTFAPETELSPDDQDRLERLSERTAAAVDSAWQAEIAERQLKELSVLHRVAVAAADATSEDELLARATELIGLELFPDNFGVMLVDSAAGVLRLHPSYQGLDADSLAAVVPLGMGISGRVVSDGRPIRRGDVRGDPAFVEIGPITLSELCVPLTVGERVVGVINAESAQKDAFSEADERLLLTLAGQLSIALDRLRVKAAERQAAQRATESRGILYEASQAINASLEPEQVYAATHSAAAQLMACEAFTIALLDEQQQRIELVYGVDRGQRLAAPRQAAPNEGITGHVLSTGQPVRAGNASELEWLSPMHFGGAEPVQSLLAVPMRLKGRVFGMLAAQSYRPAAYDDSDEQMLGLLANQAAVAMEHARLFMTEREQHHLAVVLREMGAILSTSLELEAVLDHLLEQVARLVPYDTGTIFLIEGRQCRMARMRGYERYGDQAADSIRGLTLDLDATRTLRTLVETGEPFIIPDTSQYPGWVSLAVSPHIRSWIGAPMIAQGEAVAVFALDQTAPDYYQPLHAHNLGIFAGQAALAVKNALLFQAQRQRVAALTALHEVGLDLGQQLDLPALLRMITEHAVRLVKADAGGLYLLQDDGALESAVSHNFSRDYTGLRLAAGEGIAGQVVATGEAIVAGDYSQFPSRALAYAGESIRAAIGAPVRASGKIVGVLVVTHSAPNRFGPQDAEIVTLFSDQAAVAIVNARLYAEVRANALELGQLFAASQDMAASRAPHQVLEALARHLTQGLDASSAYMVEVDLQASTIMVLAEHWSAAAGPGERVTARGMALPLADYSHAERSAREQAVLQFQLAQAELSAGERVFLTTYGVQSELIVPVLARGQTLGLATIWESRRPRVFTAAEIRLAQTLARQAADVIENARLFDALEDEKRRLELLYHLSQSLTASLNLQEVGQRALELVREAFDADGGAIFVPEDGAGPLVQAAASKASGDDDRLAVAGMDRLAEAAEQSAQLREIVSMAVALDASGGRAGQPRQERTCWLVAVPLQVGDTLVAVCALCSRAADFGADGRLSMLTAVAAPMALALQNAQLFDAEARRAHHLEALNEITRAAVSALDFPTLLQALSAGLCDLLSADVCYLTLWDETRRLPLPAAVSQPRQEVSPLVLPDSDEVSLTEAVLKAGRTLVAEDIRQAPELIDPNLAGTLAARSVIAFPLVTGGRRLGAAIVEYQTPHHFTAHEVARAEQAARQIALAIARAELFEETRRRADEVTAASEVLRALNAMPDVGQAFPAMLRGLRAISHCQRIRLIVLDQATGLFRLAADDGPTDEPIAVAFRPDDLAAAADVLAGREHLADDLAAELDYPVEAELHAAGLRSSVTLPLRAADRIVGALRLAWTRTSGYRAVNIASLAQIADAIALALEKNRLFVETRRRADELSTLVRVSAALRGARTSADMLPLFLSQACEATRAVVSTLYLLEAEAGELVMRGSYPADPRLLGLRQRADEGIAGYVAQTGENYATRDLLADPRLSLTDAGEVDYLSRVRSSLTVPLRTHEGIVGVIHVGRDAPDEFTVDEIRVLTALSEIAGSALQRANLLETLEERVAERTRLLAEANVQLKELDRLKDQFISNVSHELRTPLTNIKLHLSLLERRGTDSLGRYLPTIQRETERLRRLIEDLLDLSRLEAQIAAPRRQPLAVDNLLAEVMALHTTRAEARGLSLAQRLSAPPIVAAVDRAQMVQVFTNLIANAIAYTPDGGGVEVATRLALRQDVEGMEIGFKNWPVVIPASDLSHLFDRFFRGQTAYESGEAGTGLGLAICKEIVELHNGQIWVESSPEAVTTVTVWLPLST
jgi:GAF domain-containing protein